MDPNVESETAQPKKKSHSILIIVLIIVAILLFVTIIVISLASVLYLGVFNVGERVPEQCNFSPGMLCTSASVTENTVALGIRNGRGDDVRICGIVCDDTMNKNSVPSGGANGECTKTLATLSPGESQVVTASGGCRDQSGAVKKGGKYRGKIFITFFEPGDAASSHVMEGNLATTVK